MPSTIFAYSRRRRHRTLFISRAESSTAYNVINLLALDHAKFEGVCPRTSMPPSQASPDSLLVDESLHDWISSQNDLYFKWESDLNEFSAADVRIAEHRCAVAELKKVKEETEGRVSQLQAERNEAQRKLHGLETSQWKILFPTDVWEKKVNERVRMVEEIDSNVNTERAVIADSARKLQDALAKLRHCEGARNAQRLVSKGLQLSPSLSFTRVGVHGRFAVDFDKQAGPH